MATTLLRWVLVGSLALGQSAIAGAQAGRATPRTRPPPPTVSAIDLRRESVFDSTEATTWLPKLVNTLHVVTRASVVRRELLFDVGDPFDSAIVAESARNLRRLGIFRAVTIDSVITDSGVVARVTTRDGWSTALDLTVQRSGNQSAWSTEFLDRNFLGTHARVLAKYARDVDRSASTFEFTRPRLFIGTIGATVYYENRSDGHRYAIGMSKPFTSMTSRNGADLAFQAFGGRAFRFAEGQAAAIDTIQRRTTLVRFHGAAARRATSRGYLRFGAIAQVRRDDSAPEGMVTRIPRTITAAFGPSFEWRRARYVVTRNFEYLARQEDVDVGTRVRFDLLAAPRVLGYEHDGVGPSASIRIGAPVPGGFGFIHGRAGGIYSAAGLDSGTAVIAATAVIAPGDRRQRLVLHAERSWSKGAAIGSEFDLGFGYGPRAFRAHAFTGDRAWQATAEYRYTLVPELGKLAGVAVATFADIGGAWFEGSPERHGADVGFGLRIGPTRQADLRFVRIDLARRFATDIEAAGWVIVVGKGFTFRTAQ